MDRGVGSEKSRPGGGPAKPTDYIFLLRPMILIPVWTFYLLGAHHGSTVSGLRIPATPLAIGLVSFTALLGGIYVINQISDRDADREGGKLFLIPHAIISLRAAWIETGLLTALSLVTGYALLPQPFLVLLLIGLALGAAYSLEPVRLKRRPLFDVAANAAGNGVLNTLAGWVAIGAPLSGLLILLPYPLAVASVHLVTTLADAGSDARSGLRTSGTVIGHTRGVALAAIFMSAAVLAAAAVNNRTALYASLFSLPMFLVPARLMPWARDRTATLLPAKAATLIFSVTAGFLFPLYIPSVAAVVLLTRTYYRRRFAVSYPSLWD